MKIRSVVQQVERKTLVVPTKEFRLLGMRSKIGGPFHRETKSGDLVSAKYLNRVQKGDFVYSRLFAWQGSFGVVPSELDGCFVSNEFPLFMVDNERLDAQFLTYWFGLVSTQRLVEANCYGSTPGTRNRFKEEFFLDLEVPLPPLGTQQEIVNVLNAASESCAEALKLLRDVQSNLVSLFYSLHRQCSEAEEERADSLITLEEIVERVEPTSNYPQLGIRGFGNGLFFKEPVAGADTSYKKFNKIFAHCLVVSQPKGWEGAVAVAGLEHDGYFVSPEYRTFKCVDGKLDPEYLANLVRTPWFQFELSKMTKGQGARRERLRPEMLLNFKLRMPPIEKQREILKVVGRARKLLASNESIARDLEALLPSMLHHIFEKPDLTRSPKNRHGSLPRACQARIDKLFDEAVLVGAIVNAFADDDGQPLGNFRLQKGVYFARRHLGERALDEEFLRKAAGPYNPKMRYSGGIKIAKDNNWIARAKSAYGEGAVLGEKSSELDEWIEKSGFAKSAAWVRDKFKFRKNEQWELLATVDYAKLALEATKAIPTASAILKYIEADDEWRPKIKNLGLSEETVQNALIELQSLMLD